MDGICNFIGCGSRDIVYRGPRAEHCGKLFEACADHAAKAAEHFGTDGFYIVDFVSQEWEVFE